MKKYPTMKNSDVDWIGAIPEQWEKKRLKFSVLLRSQKSGTSSRSYVGLENIEPQTGKLIDINNEMQESVSKLFEKNDVLLGKLRPYLAKVWHANFEGKCSVEFLVFKGLDFDSKFLSLLLLSEGSIKTINSSTYGAKMPRAEWTFIGNMIFPIPTMGEQKQIVKFLDKKIGKINLDIQKNQRLIKLLKEKKQSTINEVVSKGMDLSVQMKDSGIAWIGNVPKHWKKSATKHVIKFIKSGVSRLLSTEDIGYPVLRSSNIADGKLVLGDIKYWHKEDTKGVNLKAFILDDKDIILNFINSMAQIGKSCLFLNQERSWIYTTNNFRIKILKNKVTPEYFSWLLNSNYMKKLMISISQPAVNQASFTKDDFKLLKIIYPDLDEQRKIISFLDEQTTKIDSLISKIETQIKKLQEFKQSLISSVVTGKIDVRGAVA
jgi:type I restriction enzyme, S subunit